jgi:hypothetical protein
MTANFGTEFKSVCHSREFNLLLRPSRNRNHWSPPGQGKPTRRRTHETPSDLRRRRRRIGVKPAAIRHAEAEAKAKQMQAGE